MDANTLITVAVSVVTSFVTAFAVVAFKMGRYSEKIDQLEKCNLNGRLSKLEGQFEQSQPLLKRKSPVSLTERGIAVLNASGGKAFVDGNFEELYKKVEGQNPPTPYDVQELSSSVISELKDDPRMNGVKDYLFKEGLDFDWVAPAMGVYLRDKVLERKGWNAEDIDKFDPSLKQTSET